MNMLNYERVEPGTSMNEKIRVLRIITRLNIGGPAMHASLLTGALDRDKFHVCLAYGKTAPGEGDMDYLFPQEGFASVHIPELVREISPFYDIRAFFRIYRLIREFRPHIVHTHTSKAGLLGRIAAWMAGVPKVVHTFHGHVFDGYFNASQAKLYVFLEKLLAKITDRIVIISETLCDEICGDLRVVPIEKVKIIYLGFDQKRLTNLHKKKGQLRMSLGIPEDVKTVAIVGRLVPIKNHSMFINAAVKVLERGWKVRFLIIGGGELSKDIKDRIASLEPAFNTKIVMLGWQEDIEMVYSDIDIVALTSLNEGTPVSIIEGMIVGLPVVATDVGGVKDVVKDGKNGILIRTGDVDGFVSAIESLLGDDEKRRLYGKNGREMAREKYDSRRLVEDIEELYTELTEKE